MKAKRIFLATGLGLLIFSAGHKVGAGGTADVEVDGYGGRTSGGWICGPMAGVKYGGGAGQVTFAQRDVQTPEGDREGQGTVVTLGAAVEVDDVSFTVTDPTGTPRDGFITAALAGGQVKAGYRWRWIGIEGGLGLFQGIPSVYAESPEFAPYPSVELSFGLRGKAYGVVGGGSPLATSFLRPGVYTGGGFVLANKMAFDLRAGIYRQGASVLDTVGPRIDISGRGPLSDTLSLRLGANVGFHDQGEPLDFEGSAGLIWGY